MSALKYPRAIEPSTPGAARTIFDGPSQHITCDPNQIRLISDRCLVRDLPQDDSRSGSLVVPETAQNGGVGKDGNLRIGIVVAVGPGDSTSEHGLDAQAAVRRRLLTAPCGYCGGSGVYTMANQVPPSNFASNECPICEGDGRVPIVVPPQCQPGDTILYDRRREAEVIIDGIRYAMVHSEQSVLAVLDGD